MKILSCCLRLLCAAALFALLLVSQSANASTNIQTLTDGNSSVKIDVGAPAGVFNWSVDGANQLNQQWFWFRVGASGPQSSLDSIGTPTIVHSTPGVLSATYATANYSIQTTFSLAGGVGGSGISGLGEQIKIQNLGGSSLPIHFFQYADFNISGVAQLGTGVGGKFNEALITGPGVLLTESIDTALAPGADHGEAALYDFTLNRLLTTSGLTLNNNALAGPGDVTWAFEWDPSILTGGIAPGDTFIISKTLSIEGVPEPATWSLGVLGLLALASWRRFQRSRA